MWIESNYTKSKDRCRPPPTPKAAENPSHLWGGGRWRRGGMSDAGAVMDMNTMKNDLGLWTCPRRPPRGPAQPQTRAKQSPAPRGPCWPLPPRTLWWSWGSLRALLRATHQWQHGLPKWKSSMKWQQQKTVWGQQRKVPRGSPEETTWTWRTVWWTHESETALVSPLRGAALWSVTTL